MHAHPKDIATLTKSSCPLLSNQPTRLNESARKAFARAWAAQSSGGELSVKQAEDDAGRKIKECLRLGQLVDLQWKLGVRVSSSHCKTMKSPFVAVTLRIAGSDGAVQEHPLELSMAEFNKLHNTLKDISSHLDTV